MTMNYKKLAQAIKPDEANEQALTRLTAKTLKTNKNLTSNEVDVWAVSHNLYARFGQAEVVFANDLNILNYLGFVKSFVKKENAIFNKENTYHFGIINALNGKLMGDGQGIIPDQAKTDLIEMTWFRQSPAEVLGFDNLELADIKHARAL